MKCSNFIKQKDYNETPLFGDVLKIHKYYFRCLGSAEYYMSSNSNISFKISSWTTLGLTNAVHMEVLSCCVTNTC
jgi:hypothetical protein